MPAGPFLFLLLSKPYLRRQSTRMASKGLQSRVGASKGYRETCLDFKIHTMLQVNRPLMRRLTCSWLVFELLVTSTAASQDVDI